jgi:hypothetical protein
VTPATLDPVAARRIVEARLGREPQDALETAVVLEAWTGVPAREALALGEQVMRTGTATSQPSQAAPPDPLQEDGMRAEALAFVLAVFCIASWTAPLAKATSAAEVARALAFALPVTLGLQWMLRSRFLSRDNGLELLARARRALVVGAAVIVAAPAVALGPGGLMAGVLTLTWTGGTLLVRRGWTPLYLLLVASATGAMAAGLRADVVVLGVADAIVVAVAIGLPRSRTEGGAAAGRAGRAIVAGAIGGAIGAMMLSDPSVDWVLGTAPALVLMPSTIAGMWAGVHLWHFQAAIPKALAGVPVLAGGPRRASAWPPVRILLGAVGRLVLGTIVLSAVLLAGVEALHAGHVEASLLGAFGAVALGTLLVSLLEAVGRGWWALTAVVAGLGAELAVRAEDLVPWTGGSLLAGALVAVLVALPTAIVLLLRPADTLATTLYIR